MLSVDDIRWELDDPEPPSCCVVEDIGSPRGLTASRADLVTWWRWRYAALEVENVCLGNLVVQALSDSQAYRAVLWAAIDALRKQARQHDRLREQHSRLRDEYHRHRERGLRDDEQRAGRGTAA